MIQPRCASIGLAECFLRKLAVSTSLVSLRELIAKLAHELRFSHFALITHEDLRVPRPGQVDIRTYPDAVSERIIGEGRYRRVPVIRGCVFAESAFLWSDLGNITLGRRDRAMLEFGSRHGLLEGITVPCGKHGFALGSVTFADRMPTGHAEKLLGLVQMVGIFAFKQARLISGAPIEKVRPIRLNPRPRDCVVLVGRGLSNKEIARALDLAPRTVDGYLTEARRMFGAADWTELIVAALLAGEVGLNELR